MRVALVFRNFNMGGSLERDAMLHARALVDAGFDVHAYRNPATSVPELTGVTFHDVRPATVSRSRLGYPLECASFAIAATRAIRRDRARYDIVDVHGTATWEQDVVTVHAVTKAEQRRWPFEAGKEYRAARLRAYLGHFTRPQLGVARSIERLQFRRGRFARVVAVAESVRDDVVQVHGVDPALVRRHSEPDRPRPVHERETKRRPEKARHRNSGPDPAFRRPRLRAQRSRRRDRRTAARPPSCPPPRGRSRRFGSLRARGSTCRGRRPRAFRRSDGGA